MGQPLTQDIQVYRRRLGQGLQPVMHILDAVALLGLSLPAAPHNGVDLWWAGARPLQLTSLRDALDCLGPPERQGKEHTRRRQESKVSPMLPGSCSPARL
jgi:hypothetical protein